MSNGTVTLTLEKYNEMYNAEKMYMNLLQEYNTTVSEFVKYKEQNDVPLTQLMKGKYTHLFATMVALQLSADSNKPKESITYDDIQQALNMYNNSKDKLCTFKIDKGVIEVV